MKIRRISNFQSQISFPNLDRDLELYRSSFLSSSLGQLYQSIPWEALIKELGLKDSHKGPRSIFSPRGKIALMFLKHYAACSDRKLIEQLNGNIDYQFFCDLQLPIGYRIKNYKIVSAIRCEIAAVLDIDCLQTALLKSWRSYLKDLGSITCEHHL